MESINIPQVELQMLVRMQAMEVYNAFIDPTITFNFWFAKSSGKLETGKGSDGNGTGMPSLLMYMSGKIPIN